MIIKTEIQIETMTATNSNMLYRNDETLSVKLLVEDTAKKKTKKKTSTAMSSSPQFLTTILGSLLKHPLLVAET